MNALDLLRIRLHQTFSGTLTGTTWGQPDLMSTVLKEVSSTFDTSSENTSRRSIGKSLMEFRASAKLPGFLDLKYACIGVSQKCGDDGWVLMEDNNLFPVLLREVRAHEQNPRRFRKCFQGLLAGYFDYSIFHDETPEKGRINWLRLRTFLCDNIPLIERAVPQLSWVKIISDHRNLLKDDPCRRYRKGLTQGDYTELKWVFKALAVPRSSWIWEMIVMERMKAICSFDDNGFMKQLEPCISMIDGSSVIVLSDILKKRCIAQLLSRYVSCGSHPEYPLLRDMALTLLGNPWTDRAAWDAHVNDEGARVMVDHWLKRRLISDFFHLLAKDRSVKMERLRYWLRFMPKMDDMWFALGPYALNHPGSAFKEFREASKTRIMAFENAPSDYDNAIIMRIGDFVFVELSSDREACQVFKSSEVLFDPDKKWVHLGSKSISGLPLSLNMKRSDGNQCFSGQLV